MISRAAKALLEAKLRTFPAVLIVGPRQCGKTTFIRDRLRGWRQLDLENSDDLQTLAFDLPGFFESNPRHVAIDEAQRLPHLFPALRHAIDRDRRPGRYVLTGSADPRLMKTAGETLTGRIGIIELTPFLLSELRAKPSWRQDRWFWGGYPPVHHLRSAPQRADWLGTYVSTVLERDIPALGLRAPVLALLRFCQMLAHVHGNLLNVSELGKSLALPHRTVSEYLDVLEGAFLIRRLPPYFANIGKRLTKSPKLYIRDTGLLHHLAGLTAAAQLQVWPRRGASWEGLIVEEIVRRAALEKPNARPYFWRTQAGAEVDLIIEAGGRKAAFEIKLGGAPSAQSLQGLRQCLKDLGMRRGFVVCGGREKLDLGGGIRLIPWTEVLRPDFIDSLGLD
jgi:predicted AAA+ superfamily ATPase